MRSGKGLLTGLLQALIIAAELKFFVWNTAKLYFISFKAVIRRSNETKCIDFLDTKFS